MHALHLREVGRFLKTLSLYRIYIYLLSSKKNIKRIKNLVLKSKLSVVLIGWLELSKIYRCFLVSLIYIIKTDDLALLFLPKW